MASSTLRTAEAFLDHFLFMHQEVYDELPGCLDRAGFLPQT